MPHLNLKTTIGVNASPVLDLTASTGYKNVTVGTEASYDTAKKAVSKYNFAVGYDAADFQAAAFLSDKLSTARIAYAHNLTSTVTVGGEVSRKLACGATSFALGYYTKLASGALTKYKIDNTGLLSLAYETKLANGEKANVSLQFSAADVSKPAKYGFALDL
nr:mitochondrial outer membrane porin (VDAC) [Polytomella parva]